MASTTTATGEGSAHAEPLPQHYRDEALAFLGSRPVHTVIMAGLLREHGTSIPAPRGSFYGFRGRRGGLEGVALIGRATMFEARTRAALAAFAGVARETPAVQMIMGEKGELKQFWKHYASGRPGPRLSCRELFYHFTRSDGAAEGIAGLRQATLDHLDKVVSAHAEMVKEETGLNPLDADPEGFRRRCASRVAEGKVWALIEKGELIFKAEVLIETPDAAYLEGLWVNPKRRHQGYGRRCWTQLSRALLERLPSLCGFANAENSAAYSFYERVGGVLLGRYDKVYL